MSSRILIVTDDPADPDFIMLCSQVRESCGVNPIICVTDGPMAPLPAADDRASRYMSRILVKRGGKVIPIKVEDIVWIEGAGNYARLHTRADTFLFRSIIGRLQNDLDPDMFQRINRSVMVNMNAVREIRPDYKGDYLVALADGLELKLTRVYRDAVFKQFAPGKSHKHQLHDGR